MHKQKQAIPYGTACFWYSGANQIRTIFLFSQSGFYVIECDGFRAILVVKGDDQLIIVEINPVNESIDYFYYNVRKSKMEEDCQNTA